LTQHINEAGSDNLPLRVDGPFGSGAPKIANANNSIIFNSQVGSESRPS
jgi:hypothetical protein